MHVFDVLLKKKTVQLSIAGNSYYIYIYLSDFGKRYPTTEEGL